MQNIFELNISEIAAISGGRKGKRKANQHAPLDQTAVLPVESSGGVGSYMRYVIFAFDVAIIASTVVAFIQQNYDVRSSSTYNSVSKLPLLGGFSMNIRKKGLLTTVAAYSAFVLYGWFH